MTIAGAVSVRLLDPEGLLAHHPLDSFGPAPQEGALELRLKLTRAPAPSLADCELIFDSTSLWKVRRLGPAHAFELPQLTAIIDFPARSGRIHLRDEAGPAFAFPLDEVVFSRLLAERGLVIVHACGLAHRGRGLLLAGPSGAGKSTTADLWAKRAGAHILSDDRVAVGMRAERVVMAGTPWHGSSRHASARLTDLTRILMLEHASQNRLRPIPAASAAAGFLSMCVIPYWHPPSAELALDAALGVAARIPVAELGFVPDASAVDYLVGLADQAGSPRAPD